MAKISLREPEGPYEAQLDTEEMVVTIKDAFLGVRFVTESGETLSVSMRDSGFELKYAVREIHQRAPLWIELKGGEVNKKETI